MSKCRLKTNFFREGRRDALAEVRILRDAEQWTSERRARWIKEAAASCSRLYPEGRAYFKGRMAALKSYTTKDFSSDVALQGCEATRGTDVYHPLPPGETRFCGFFDCGETAVWGIALVGESRLVLVLCDRCRQEWERETQAYTVASGWDWDEDEDLHLASLAGHLSLKRKEDVLVLGQIALPTAVLLGFDVSNLLSLTSHPAMLEELLIVMCVAAWSRPLIRLLLFLDNLLDGGDQ